jgi:hypothetical protein
MQNYTLAHVGDAVLLHDLTELVTRDRATTAMLLAHMAEVDARRLYAPAGYSSMHGYCVGELGLSEDAAKRRIQAARAARQFPAIFHAIAEGRLHLTGVCLIAPHLTPENARTLIELASHKRKVDIEELLARHFVIAEGRIRILTPVPPEVSPPASPPDEGEAERHAQDEGALAHLPDLQRESPPERCLLRPIIAKSTEHKLHHAQALLSHALPNGDVAQVLDRALDALIRQLERRKIGAGQPGRKGPVPRSRRIPAHVRRAVWDRDQAQCTFVGSTGHRCAERHSLEFDHVDPMARGGLATIDNIRLRCRAHNQHEAERAFGATFMKRKRQEARLAAVASRARAVAEEQTLAVVTGLRGLGCSAHDARHAAEFSETLQCDTLEERMRAALKFITRK